MYSELGVWYRGLLAPVSGMTSQIQLVVCAEAQKEDSLQLNTALSDFLVLVLTKEKTKGREYK